MSLPSLMSYRVIGIDLAIGDSYSVTYSTEGPVEKTLKESKKEKKGSLDNGSRLAKKLRRLGWIPQRQKTIRGTNG